MTSSTATPLSEVVGPASSFSPASTTVLTARSSSGSATRRSQHQSHDHKHQHHHHNHRRARSSYSSLLFSPLAAVLLICLASLHGAEAWPRRESGGSNNRLTVLEDRSGEYPVGSMEYAAAAETAEEDEDAYVPSIENSIARLNR